MGNAWGREVPLKEVLRKNKREIQKAVRELDKERGNLEKQEQKLIGDIRKFAKEGHMGPVKIMAKDLVRTRTYITKFIELRSHLSAVGLKLQTVKSQQAMAEAMGSVTKAMVKMNKAVNIPTIQKIMTNFARENERAEFTQEIMGDLLDDAMEQDGDEEEQDKIVSQVLDEIGIDFGDAVPQAPELAPAGQMQQTNVAGPQQPVAVASQDGPPSASGGGGGGNKPQAPPPPPSSTNNNGGTHSDPTVSDLEARLNNLRK